MQGSQSEFSLFGSVVVSCCPGALGESSNLLPLFREWLKYYQRPSV